MSSFGLIFSFLKDGKQELQSNVFRDAVQCFFGKRKILFCKLSTNFFKTSFLKIPSFFSHEAHCKVFQEHWLMAKSI